MRNRLPLRFAVRVALCAGCCALWGAAALAMQELKTIPPPLVIEGADNLHDIRYLPEWRYTGRAGPRGDYEMLLNLYLPKDRGPERLPLVMFVHGGAYSAGYKDEYYPVQLLRTLVARGFAVGSLNYILAPKGIVPQVWWDFEEAARFLRVNAARYGLDPNAFGAVGISAGGWLITTAGHSDGAVYTLGINTYVHETALRDHTHRPKFLEAGPATFLRPTLAPTTAYPGVSGRWQVMAYDFAMMTEYANGFSPVLIGMVGQKHTDLPDVLKGRNADWVPLVLGYPPLPARYDKGVHAPNMQETVARRLDGAGEAPISDVLADLLRRHLVGPEARTPAPEIWPADRRVSGPVQMTMVTTDPAVTVYYTLDGGDPTPASPRYEKPVTVPPGTCVRAVAQMPGRRPSRTVAATFLEAPPKPRITAPESRDLPPGETGKPYHLTFRADQPNARFSLMGDLNPRLAVHPKASTEYPNNMMLAGDGTFSGTPVMPGTFWLQVWVNDGPGRVATHRDYTWTVTGRALAREDEAPATADTYVQLATLVKWTERNLHYLTGEMQQKGVRSVLQTVDQQNVMLLVPSGQEETARRVFEEIRNKTGQTAVLDR